MEIENSDKHSRPNETVSTVLTKESPEMVTEEAEGTEGRMAAGISEGVSDRNTLVLMKGSPWGKHAHLRVKNN